MNKNIEKLDKLHHRVVAALLAMYRSNPGTATHRAACERYEKATHAYEQFYCLLDGDD